jgi:hypothetical protein
MTTLEQLTEQVRTQLNAIIDPCSQTAGAPAGLIDMRTDQAVDHASLLPHGRRLFERSRETLA